MIAAGVCGVVLVGGIIAAALALNGQGGGTPTDGPALATAPTFTATIEDDELVYTIDFEGYQEGDRYLVKTAQSKDVIDQATAYGVSDVDRSTGTGNFTQAFGSSTTQCAQVRVQRGVDYSPWSDTTCTTQQ